MLLTPVAVARDSVRNIASGTSSMVFHVVVCDIRLIEQEQGALEVIQYVLLGFAVSYVLEEVQISLFGTPELLV